MVQGIVILLYRAAGRPSAKTTLQLILNISGKERNLGRLPEIEDVETGGAFARMVD
jgi:hypothetical protein